MAKKSKLNGFVFKKLDEISNGLKIPMGNAIRQQAPPPPKEFIEEPVYIPPAPVRQQVAKPTSKPRIAPFRKLDIDSTLFTPMTNIVPTIQPVSVPTNELVVVPTQEPTYKGLTRRQKQRVTHEDLDLVEFAAQVTIHDKIIYLSLRGWALKVKERGNGLYRFATKYINRKKKSIYLGSVNRELSEPITIKRITV